MFRTLHYIDEVCRTKSFSTAAQNLFISQPSLSLTIKKFETEIGVKLFDRSTSPIQLTDAGKIYLEGIQRILAVEHDLNDFLDDYNELKVGELSLGAPHFFSSYLLPPFIAQFHMKYPYIKINLIETDFLNLQSLITNGDVDLLVESSEFDNEHYDSYPLFPEHVLLAVPISDPINQSLRYLALNRNDVVLNKHRSDDFPCVPLKEFRSHSFLLLEKGHDMHSRAMKFCEDSGFSPHVIMTLNQLMTVFSLVNQQMGVSFVSDTIAKLNDNCRNILFYKLDSNLSFRNINIAHKRNRYVSRPMRKFIEMMLQSTTEVSD